MHHHFVLPKDCHLKLKFQLPAQSLRWDFCLSRSVLGHCLPRKSTSHEVTDIHQLTLTEMTSGELWRTAAPRPSMGDDVALGPGGGEKKNA